MLTSLFIILAFLLGAAAGRVRGSSLPFNDTEKRYAIWGGVVAVTVAIGTRDFIFTLLAIPLAGIGATLGYWGQFDLSVSANRTWRNYAILSATGCFRMFPLFLAGCFLGYGWQVLPAVLAGALFVPAYLLGGLVNIILNIEPLITEASEWGEIFFWGSLAAVLALGLSV